MLRNFDESELLELIEGELDAAQAGALRARLAGDAKAQAFVERVMMDRVALRALPEPELPVDFLAQNEQLLARPMLMEPVVSEVEATATARPGQYRRRQQQLRWRVRWPRLAAAAVVLLGVGAGAWWGVAMLLPKSSAVDGLVARNDAPTNENVNDGVTAMAAADEIRGTIHHAPPAPPTEGVRPEVLAAMTKHQRVESSDRVASVSGPTPVVDAGFALVVSAADVESVEQSIGGAVMECSDRSVLVRNFSFDEARRLESEWRLANAGSAGAGPGAVADVRSSNVDAARAMSELAAHVRQQLSAQNVTIHRATGEKSAEPVSGTLAGDDELSPTLEQQLDLSSRGATHTIVIPASMLRPLLQSIGTSNSQTTMLRVLAVAKPQGGSSASTVSAAQPLAAWLTDGPQIRAAMQRFAAEDDVLVRLPVVIEASAAMRK